MPNNRIEIAWVALWLVSGLTVALAIALEWEVAMRLALVLAMALMWRGLFLVDISWDRISSSPRIARPFANRLLSLIIPNDQALGDLLEELGIRAESSPTVALIWFAWQVAGSAFFNGLRAIVRVASFRQA